MGSYLRHHYMVDYQKWPEAKAERRQIDRLVPGGRWSGNVYGFSRRVYQKPIADLKVPFRLQDGHASKTRQCTKPSARLW